MGQLSQLRRLGSKVKRIKEAKKRIGEIKEVIASGIDVKEWFFKIPVKMEKDSFVALLQNRISKIGNYKRATTERQARYLTIVYETVQQWPSGKIDPKDAIQIGKSIEKKLTQYDSENPN